MDVQAMGSTNQWADEELTAFYQHYHNTTKEWDKVGWQRQQQHQTHQPQAYAFKTPSA
jgi:hypothetical protein